MKNNKIKIFCTTLIFVSASMLFGCDRNVIDNMSNQSANSVSMNISDDNGETNEADSTDLTVPSNADDMDSIEEQINVLALNTDVWMDDGCKYAVTDMDFDSYLEIMAVHYDSDTYESHNKMFEVSDSGDLHAISYFGECESEPDIGADSCCAAYYNSELDSVNYIFDDFYYDGDYVNDMITSFNVYDDAIIVNNFGYSYSDNKGNYGYVDWEGSIISKEEYDSITDLYFAGLDKKYVKYRWLYFSESSLSDISELYDSLLDSYNYFGISDYGDFPHDLYTTWCLYSGEVDGDVWLASAQGTSAYIYLYDDCTMKFLWYEDGQLTEEYDDVTFSKCDGSMYSGCDNNVWYAVANGNFNDSEIRFTLNNEGNLEMIRYYDVGEEYPIVFTAEYMHL